MPPPEDSRDRARWAYRRGLLVSAIYHGTWGSATVPPDFADDPSLMAALAVGSGQSVGSRRDKPAGHRG